MKKCMSKLSQLRQRLELNNKDLINLFTISKFWKNNLVGDLMFDTIILNGIVIDGTGKKRKKG